MTMSVLSPVSGVAVALATVPDLVFAEALVGPGVAIEPDLVSAEVVAPISGRIAKLHPHAFVVVGSGGRGVLVHLGIDTVQLRGDGFELLAVEGDEVTAGTAIVRWDPAAVAASGRSPICPVVALDAASEDLSGLVVSGALAAGSEVFTWN